MTTKCKHQWIVFSVAYAPPTILVQCSKCKAYGGILDHSPAEWGNANFSVFASDPYPWLDNSSVILEEDLPGRVIEQDSRVRAMRAHSGGGEPYTIEPINSWVEFYLVDYPEGGPAAAVDVTELADEVGADLDAVAKSTGCNHNPRSQPASLFVDLCKECRVQTVDLLLKSLPSAKHYLWARSIRKARD